MKEECTFSKWVATKIWSLFGWCCQVSSCHSSVLTTGFFVLHVLLLLSGHVATNFSPSQGNSIIALIIQILYSWKHWWEMYLVDSLKNFEN